MKKSLLTGILACLMVIQPAPAKAQYDSSPNTLAVITALGIAQIAGWGYLAVRAATGSTTKNELAIAHIPSYCVLIMSGANDMTNSRTMKALGRMGKNKKK